MNELTNTTSENPWEDARRLTKELSAKLKECGGDWYASIMPPVPQTYFGAYPMGNAPDDTAIDRVNRLAWELADALNDYMDGRFQARIYPSDQAGYAVMFTVTSAAERRFAP